MNSARLTVPLALAALALPLGADHAHVLIAVVFNLWLLAKLARGFTTYRLNAVQAITFYVHAVNVITIVVIGVLLSARA